MVAVLGQNMASEPAPFVRGTPLADDDPLAAEWVVIVMGTHLAAALVARQAEIPAISGEVADSRYEYAITYDRGLVVSAAQCLMQRIDSQ